MIEPKLLTEAEWAGLLGPTGYELHGPELRERGLIAPEPVDPLLIEAREIVAQAYNWTQRCFENNHPAVVSTLAGIKRGKELAQPKPLTRERVAEAFKSVFGFHSDYNTDRLHAALMEQMQ